MKVDKDVAHAVLGASNAHRWMSCPGSVRLGREVKQDDDSRSFYAREGSCAHWVAAQCLDNGLDPVVYVGAKHEGVTVTEDMAAAVAIYVDKVRNTAPDAQLFVEVGFSLERLGPPEDMFGTTDAAKWDEKSKHLYVWDFKYGSGVTVEVKNNPQLLYYALGAVLALDIVPDRITTGIVQPRAPHPDGIVRVHSYHWSDLVAFKHELLTAADRTQDPEAELHLGYWCRFCPAAAVCPMQHDNAVALAQQEFEAMAPATLPAPETLSDDMLAEILEKAELVEDWLRAVRQYVTHRLENAEPFAGWKLIAKKANRRWRSEEEALRTLLTIEGVTVDDCTTPPKLISPRQAELMLRRFGALLPDGLTVRESTGHNLVPASDPRPEAVVTEGEEFDTA